MEMENKYASRGVAGTALGLGAGALGVELLRGGLGGLLGGATNYCAEDHLVNRYEAAQQARIAELETEVKLRDSNIYTDQKILETYKYFDGELRGIRNELAAQAVLNARTESAIARERDERCCGDNAIVNYANATFYPKMVADITTGTTTTAQMVYNPIPNCGCCGK
jgi:hypothetical protein